MCRLRICLAVVAGLLTSPVAAEQLDLALEEVRLVKDTISARLDIQLRLTPDSARRFAAFTAARIDQQVHLSVDNIALNSPVLRGVIPGGVIMLSPGGYEVNGHTTAGIVSRLEAAGIVTISD